MNTENNQTPEYDYYVVILPVEFLPGMRSTLNVSLEISDKDIALQSLEHVRKQYPEARLAGQKWLDLNNEMDEHRSKIKKRTDAIRKHLEAVA